MSEDKKIEETQEKSESTSSSGDEYVEIPVGKYLSSLRNNPWKVSTIVLAIFLIAVIVFNPFNSGTAVTGNTITANEAGQNAVNFINSNPNIQGEATLLSVEQDGQFYQATINYQGQQVPVYLTLDGEYLLTGPPVSLTEEIPASQDTQNQQPAEVPKSDKSKVELFIWSYCPYGVQAQGPLAEVASLLGDSADFEVIPYHDGHGAYENQQNKIQSCIQEIAPDKYWDYAAGFVKDIYPKCGASRDAECDKTESIKLMKSLKIGDAKIMSCVDEKGDELFSESIARAQAYEVQGSPTLIINGVKVNVARTAEAYKTAVCNAFTTAPEACSTTLDSSAATTTGNC
ncbi:MAG: hypothetical protein ABIG28_02785 [archaeon]